MWRRREGFVFWILRWRFAEVPTPSGIENTWLTRIVGFVQGVKQVKKTDLNARFLFLSPPSPEILEQRLRGRGTDNEESIQKRLEQAKNEMAFAKEAGEKIVVNNELDKAYKEVEEWIVDGGKYGSQS